MKIERERDREKETERERQLPHTLLCAGIRVPLYKHLPFCELSPRSASGAVPPHPCDSHARNRPRAAVAVMPDSFFSKEWCSDPSNYFDRRLSMGHRCNARHLKVNDFRLMDSQHRSHTDLAATSSRAGSTNADTRRISTSTILLF